MGLGFSNLVSSLSSCICVEVVCASSVVCFVVVVVCTGVCVIAVCEDEG
jgi:hypothetical protein